MFFKQEKLDSNNEKDLVKTIACKLQYVTYDSTTTAIANLISLANIGPRVQPFAKNIERIAHAKKKL